jgi:NADPH:quinone reductase-like Zn-dependent oxidoreductase
LRAGQTVLVSGAAGAVGRCAVYMAKVSGAHVIAGVERFQLDQAESIGADETIALDDPAAFAAIPQVDVVANAVRGKTATDLLAKVKDGGTFASVTGAPAGANDYPRVRVVPFRSQQDREGIAFIADAVNAGKVTIPIGRREELKNAGAAQAAFTKGGIGKVLLIP